jgi:hypothetical protein
MRPTGRRSRPDSALSSSHAAHQQFPGRRRGQLNLMFSGFLGSVGHTDGAVWPHVPESAAIQEPSSHALLKERAHAVVHLDTKANE